ncbi:hypothetical protein ACH5RR_009138 [Cinchona calisaya]|uniref:Uncharacterized protein n=1 Tax=Cinchona calisaya TaxID=153742 RepID=A0ABD3ADB2_9GENT
MAHQHHNLTVLPVDATNKAVDIVAARELPVNIIAAQEVAIKTTTTREFSNDNAVVLESVIDAATTPNRAAREVAVNAVAHKFDVDTATRHICKIGTTQQDEIAATIS